LSHHLNIECFLNEKEDVRKQIQSNNFFIYEGNFLPSDYDYKHLNNKQKYFKDNELEYVNFNSNLSVIGKFSIFLTLPSELNVKNLKFDYSTFTTLNPLDVKTNNNSLMLAYYSGIIKDFIGEEEVILTYSGEIPQENYDFFIQSTKNRMQKISLRNYSSYIDGVFESQNKVVLLVNELYNTEDISLKELFIPFLYFGSKTSKEIVIIFMSFSKCIFRLFEINFYNSDIMNYASLSKFSSYKISNDKFTYSDIINVLNNVSLVDEKEIPFPQANEFVNIVKLIDYLNESELNFDEITEKLKVVERQTNYYTDAGVYLNLVQFKIFNKTKRFNLTDRGRKIVSSNIKNKNLGLIKCVLEHEVFNKTLKLYVKNSKMPSINEIVEIMKESNIYNVNSESTFRRRASTVQSWIKWIIDLP
jgi:hypothetical protein